MQVLIRIIKKLAIINVVVFLVFNLSITYADELRDDDYIYVNQISEQN